MSAPPGRFELTKNKLSGGLPGRTEGPEATTSTNRSVSRRPDTQGSASTMSDPTHRDSPSLAKRRAVSHPKPLSERTQTPKATLDTLAALQANLKAKQQSSTQAKASAGPPVKTRAGTTTRSNAKASHASESPPPPGPPPKKKAGRTTRSNVRVSRASKTPPPPGPPPKKTAGTTTGSNARASRASKTPPPPGPPPKKTAGTTTGSNARASRASNTPPPPGPPPKKTAGTTTGSNARASRASNTPPPPGPPPKKKAGTTTGSNARASHASESPPPRDPPSKKSGTTAISNAKASHASESPPPRGPPSKTRLPPVISTTRATPPQLSRKARLEATMRTRGARGVRSPSESPPPSNEAARMGIATANASHFSTTLSTQNAPHKQAGLPQFEALNSSDEESQPFVRGTVGNGARVQRDVQARGIDSDMEDRLSSRPESRGLGPLVSTDQASSSEQGNIAKLVDNVKRGIENQAPSAMPMPQKVIELYYRLNLARAGVRHAQGDLDYYQREERRVLEKLHIHRAIQPVTDVSRAFSELEAELRKNSVLPVQHKRKALELDTSGHTTRAVKRFRHGTKAITPTIELADDGVLEMGQEDEEAAATADVDDQQAREHVKQDQRGEEGEESEEGEDGEEGEDIEDQTEPNANKHQEEFNDEAIAEFEEALAEPDETTNQEVHAVANVDQHRESSVEDEVIGEQAAARSTGEFIGQVEQYAAQGAMDEDLDESDVDEDEDVLTPGAVDSPGAETSTTKVKFEPGVN